MKIQLDSDVEKVLEFMAREIEGERLLFVARSVAQLAELGWSNLTPQAASALLLSEWPGQSIIAKSDRQPPAR